MCKRGGDGLTFAFSRAPGLQRRLLVLGRTPSLLTWQVNDDFLPSVLLALPVSSCHLNVNNDMRGRVRDLDALDNLL